jgi:hypothetical protein
MPRNHLCVLSRLLDERVFTAGPHHLVGRRGSWRLALHSCRMRSRPGLLGPGGSLEDITWGVVSFGVEERRGKHTRSIAARSSSVTLIACAPGGSGASLSPSSLSNCRNCSGCCPINCANCGLPAPTCWRMGSSIWGCCCTTWRSCWNWGLLRRKSRLPSPPGPAAAAAAAAPPGPNRFPAPPRAPAPRPPPPRPAAASKRLTDSSPPSPPSAAGAAGVGEPAPPAAGAACLCSC